MKKVLMISLLSLFISSFVQGQAALIVLILGDKVATEQFHLSIDAGLNLSNFNGLDQEKTGGGVNFGLGTHIKLGEKWHLKPEFKPLSRKGPREVASITTVPGDITVSSNKFKLNYIDVPVLLQYNITEKFFVSAGPQVSFLTKAFQISSGTVPNGEETTIKITTKSSFNSVNFSVPVEAGVSVNLGSKKSTSKMNVNFFARYEYDFIEVFKDPSLGSSRISMFQIGASLPFIKSPEELAKGKN
jgi:hypothetical protein